MDWSKTKTIFIISFLVLDIFLALQFFDKKNSSNYELSKTIPIEERLAAENIKFPNDLSNANQKGSYIKGERKVFSEEDLKELTNQEATTVQNDSIRAELEEPLRLPESNWSTRLNTFVRDSIIFGSEYVYWKRDKEKNQIYYYQEYKGKIIFQNPASNDIGIGLLILNIDSDNQIVSYEQTYMDSIQEVDEQQDILAPIKAIEALYDKRDIRTNSTVTKVELGYYTRYPLSTTQILLPTWHIEVDGKDDYFVNALVGEIIRP
ncbi:two-component system regulatory protein YycI [Metabacillus lacus]|uniref:two-component system regulatory protein YycI n=1 Tax=Metabacillus lacus TaxID=1983721 RepID=UPI00147831F0